MKHRNGKSFSLRIILPTLFAILFFVVSMFVIIIPSLKRELMEDKREMIHELTNSAWSILEEQHTKEKGGLLTRQEAQKRAIEAIQCLRYGKERKDYFWITDTTPVMIMHPYRDDLQGINLSDYTDKHEKKLFSEMVETAQKHGDGFVDYLWQWKDDQTRIVPKVSYVKSFPPWNWIIGTGIYLEDVEEEIGAMSSTLIKTSSAITLLIALLLFYITLESLNIEKGREHAEKDLEESEKKYRALVEASTEGVLMFIEGKLVYSNKPVLDLLGHTEGLTETDLDTIFSQDAKSYQSYKDVLKNHNACRNFEATLFTAHGNLLEVQISVVSITLENQEGVILTVKDISKNKKIEEELGLSRQRYQSLADNLHLGVFRIDVSKKGNFIEANPATAEIFGFKNREQLFQTPLSLLFMDLQDWENLKDQLREEGFVKEIVLPLRRHDGTNMVISISMGGTLNDEGVIEYFEGIIEDITERAKGEQERENLIVELQTSLLFINQPIKEFAPPPRLTCTMSCSIHKAAKIMKKHRQSAILIQTETGDDIGIVTDYDISHRFVAENMAPETPVYQIMSSPIISVPDDALVFEAALLIQEESIRHLLTRGEDGRINGIIDNRDLLHFHQYSSSLLIREIHEAESVDTLAEAHDRLPRMIKTLIDSGAKSENITKLISKVSDLISDKIITFAIEELGPPPVDFSFVALGSEGRAEQTLVTDQDNAIIYEDVEEDKKEETHAYFMSLGKKVCENLGQVGYRLCEGEIMAMNPKWCQPFSSWKNYFHHWITEATPQNLLEINIFFDFRTLHGKRRFTDELRQYIDDLLQKNRLFFIYFAQNALLYKPPIGFFGKIVVGSSDKKPETFNIKNAMKLLLNFARIYSLQHNIAETNTLLRMKKLYEIGAIKKNTYKETTEVYNYLMQIRLKHQTIMMSSNMPPDNFINLKSLTDIELTMLKRALSHLSDIQTKISYHFKGSG
jgi:PAS domain S-box-containing protein